MKKSIKYAGFAAATLIAAAPVAAPILNATSMAPNTENTAKASFGTSTQEDAYNTFDSTFKNYNSATQLDFVHGATFALLQSQNRLPYSAEMVNGILRPLHPQYQSSLNDLSVVALLNQIVFVVVPADGQTTSEWQTAMRAAGQHGGQVNYRIVGLAMSDVADHALWSNQQLVKYFEPVKLNGKALDKTVYAKTSVTQQEVHAMNINFETPVDGYVGQSKSDFSTTGKYPITIQDNLGNKVDPQDVTSTFFNGLDLATIINGTTLPKAGKVVQKMTVKFNRNEYNALFNDLDQITINGEEYSGGLLSKVWDKVNNSVTLTRQIDVTLDNYTDKDIKGVVTTPIVNMGDSSIVTHMYDGKGNRISGRALAQGTDWYTDTKRLNNNTGEVMYRVSTNEWVKAADISYADKDTDTDTGDTAGLTDITNLPANSTVTLDGPAGFVYSLYGSDGKTASRGLAGDSAWLADKQAKDSNGNVYYRVSTNEWIMQGTGVTLK
ncbi:SLAP domain-containing protein [Companilactobacillus ginsenosidimutans]|uniref:Surface layer protein A domain-containing protein n=1 Tax=Companilactobacillus ginsenosidimutans TaxID=1007676 RepID=A0A0H4QMX1_9LACO|nr:SLAP domain-containing protein [Companilactobacillus ginsenosidimutans]AKP68068.1 hypothetical protein ABM34_11340 [Companilactobacillus ginsenosidimutans]